MKKHQENPKQGTLYNVLQKYQGHGKKKKKRFDKQLTHLIGRD